MTDGESPAAAPTVPPSAGAKSPARAPPCRERREHLGLMGSGEQLLGPADRSRPASTARREGRPRRSARLASAFSLRDAERRPLVLGENEELTSRLRVDRGSKTVSGHTSRRTATLHSRSQSDGVLFGSPPAPRAGSARGRHSAHRTGDPRRVARFHLTFTSPWRPLAKSGIHWTPSRTAAMPSEQPSLATLQFTGGSGTVSSDH